MIIIAASFLVVGGWKLHAHGEEATARAEAHSLLPAEAHVISEQAQSCGSDAGVAHECVRIEFQLGGLIADQTATFNALAENHGWQSFSQSTSPGAYALTFVKPPERIEVTLFDSASPACHPESTPNGQCANTLSSFPYGGYVPSP